MNSQNIFKVHYFDHLVRSNFWLKTVLILICFRLIVNLTRNCHHHNRGIKWTEKYTFKAKHRNFLFCVFPFITVNKYKTFDKISSLFFWLKSSFIHFKSQISIYLWFLVKMHEQNVTKKKKMGKNHDSHMKIGRCHWKSFSEKFWFAHAM